MSPPPPLLQQLPFNVCVCFGERKCVVWCVVWCFGGCDFQNPTPVSLLFPFLPPDDGLAARVRVWCACGVGGVRTARGLPWRQMFSPCPTQPRPPQPTPARFAPRAPRPRAPRTKPRLYPLSPGCVCYQEKAIPLLATNTRSSSSTGLLAPPPLSLLTTAAAPPARGRRLARRQPARGGGLRRAYSRPPGLGCCSLQHRHLARPPGPSGGEALARE